MQITLGCFGPPDEPLPVEDECCDDALDNLQAPPIRGKCPRSLERCVRPGVGYLCAKDDDRDGMSCQNSSNRRDPCFVVAGLVSVYMLFGESACVCI